MPERPEEEQIRVQDAVEDYQSTVHAMLAFSAFVVHDSVTKRPNSHFGFGRRMTTSKTNPVVASADVTPDIVAQKNATYGIVAEVKRSLPADRTKWSSHVVQLRKYDDDLKGWWTKGAHIAASDTTLLVHQSRSRAFVSVLEEENARDAASVGPHTSVIEFNRSDERQVNYFFRLEWGEFRDSELSARLKEGVQVPIDNVIKTFSNVKFYDADPPLHTLLLLLWIDYFGPLAAVSEYDENLKAFPITVNAYVITDELQKAYGSQLLERDERSAEFPTTHSVRKALDAFVTMRLAMGVPDAKGDYRVLYRQFREDVLQRFASMLTSPAEKVLTQGELPFVEQPAIQASTNFERPNAKATKATKATKNNRKRTSSKSDRRK